MSPLRAVLLAGIASMVFVAAACSDDSNGDTPSDADGGSPSPPASTATPRDETETPGTPTVTATATAGTPAATSTAGTATGTPGTGGGATSSFEWDESVLELRDGTWQVGEAGEVEFTVVDANRLELVDVRPASGWTETDRETEEDEIEVDFRRDNVEWKIQVEIEGGVLEIEIDQDIDNGEPGLYTVGLAGTVEFGVDGGSLTLIEVVPNDGWSQSVELEDDDEIEVDFERENVTWDFDVELDDGAVDIDIDFEIEGQFQS